MPLFDCAACGACCREAYHVVELGRRDPFLKLHRDLVAWEEGRPVLPRPGGRCVCLTGETGSFSCRHYDTRPRTCRDFPVGEESCLEARKRVGIVEADSGGRPA